MPRNLVRAIRGKPTGRKTPSVVGRFSPDDLAIVQKRQDWRLRVAQISIEHFEHTEKPKLANARKSAHHLEELGKQFARISDYIHRDLSPLLETGVSVHELEVVRYQANYFLDALVKHLREGLQKRHGTSKPLLDSRPEEVRREVISALEEQSDSLCVFVEDVVKLAQFELEVTSQRNRIRLLLGGDRRLSGLGNNETIMKAPLAELWGAVEEFTSSFGYLKENLPPLLEKASPYPKLEEELRVAGDQFRSVVRERVEPFEIRLAYKRAQDARLAELEATLAAAANQAATLTEEAIPRLTSQASEGGVTAAQLHELQTDARRLEGALRDVPSGIVLAETKVASHRNGEPAATGLQALNRRLEAVLSRVPLLAELALDDTGPEAIEGTLGELEARVGALRAALAEALPELERFREERIRRLREHFCSVLGEVRTFLQTGFAHIASKDPRSTESSYHFFLREFSDEAKQATLLLTELRTLESSIQQLQRLRIAGLPLTPDHLARILRVLFKDKDDERKRIPGGEGWKLMSSFLTSVRDELVPRLQKVCALDGIRYEDKNFLSEWAMDLARNCTLCLAEHKIGYDLLQEMGRLRDDPESPSGRSSYTHIVTARTCQAMQDSLTEICMTLTASIPYVGIMRGGVERRASIFFHRQQKLLESSSESGDDSDGFAEPDDGAAASAKEL